MRGNLHRAARLYRKSEIFPPVNRMILSLIFADRGEYHGKYHHKAKYREGNLQKTGAPLALYFSRFIWFYIF
jgi:hypothetical protein